AAHRSRLARLPDRLREETARLHQLTQQHAIAQQRLEQRLVELYETNQTTELEILLQVQSLSDLLDQIDYFHSIGDQDRRIADTLKRLQLEMRVARQNTASTKIEVAKTTAILARKTEQQRAARQKLLIEQAALAAARSSKQSILANVHQQRQSAEEDLNAMQRAS